MDKPNSVRRLHQATAVAIFVAGLLLLRGSLDLRYYTPMGPGPGFFPLWLSAILTILAVLMFLQTTFAKSPDKASGDVFPDAGGYLRIATIPVALGIVALAMERFGFGPSMFVANMLVMLVLTKRHFLVLLAIALIGSFGIEYVFVQWLNVPMPRTDLGALCPQLLCGE